MFILAAQRDEDCQAAFKNYRDYLKANESRFPRSAYELATSDWYFNPSVHWCPHDAWLERVAIVENAVRERGNDDMPVEMVIKLLGPYHDGIIEFRYPQVFGYRFDSYGLNKGHKDWRYDEFRLDDHDRLVHEIEWCGFHDTGTWKVVSNDVEFTWKPF